MLLNQNIAENSSLKIEFSVVPTDTHKNEIYTHKYVFFLLIFNKRLCILRSYGADI